MTKKVDEFGAFLRKRDSSLVAAGVFLSTFDSRRVQDVVQQSRVHLKRVFSHYAKFDAPVDEFNEDSAHRPRARSFFMSSHAEISNAGFSHVDKESTTSRRRGSPFYPSLTIPRE